MRYERSAPKAAPASSACWLAVATSLATGLAAMAGNTARCATHDVAPMTPQASRDAARIQPAMGSGRAPSPVGIGGRFSSPRPRGRPDAALVVECRAASRNSDDLTHGRGRDGERLAEVQVVGEIAMERERLLGRGGRRVC